VFAAGSEHDYSVIVLGSSQLDISARHYPKKQCESNIWVDGNYVSVEKLMVGCVKKNTVFDRVYPGGTWTERWLSACAWQWPKNSGATFVRIAVLFNKARESENVPLPMERNCHLLDSRLYKPKFRMGLTKPACATGNICVMSRPVVYCTRRIPAGPKPVTTHFWSRSRTRRVKVDVYMGM
jgi:hypothetical protein